jgi:hypothetical protein
MMRGAAIGDLVHHNRRISDFAATFRGRTGSDSAVVAKGSRTIIAVGGIAPFAPQTVGFFATAPALGPFLAPIKDIWRDFEEAHGFHTSLCMLVDPNSFLKTKHLRLLNSCSQSNQALGFHWVVLITMNLFAVPPSLRHPNAACLSAFRSISSRLSVLPMRRSNRP